MDESIDEDQTPDDPQYWDNIVEELLDIDTSQTTRRKSSALIIKVVTPELVSAGEDSDSENAVEQGYSADLLDRPYIFEDGDSEALQSETNSEYMPQEDSEGEDNPDRQLSDREQDHDGDVDCDSHHNSLDDIPDECREQNVSLCDIIQREDMEVITNFITQHAEDIGAICLVSDESGTSPVTAAASLGSLGILEQLSEAGVWLSCTDGDGKMAIHRAVENGRNEVVEWLASKGQWTGRTKDGMSAIHIAAISGQFQAINILMNVAANVDEENPEGRTPLQLAVDNEHVEIAELLIGKGADVNHLDSKTRTPMHAASETGQAVLIDLLSMYGADLNCKLVPSGQTPLHIAVENNHYQVVSKLLDAGADVDIRDGNGDTVLHKLHVSDMPIDSMSSMCQKSKDIDLRNAKGRSALFLAVESGNIDASVVLVQNHSNVNMEVSTGCTPLYAATHYGHWDIVDKLILAGANVNKQTENGSTALYKAARNDQFHIVALLLCSGAKIDLARKTGWTPLHVAVHHGNNTIVEQLVAAGADCNIQDQQGQTALAIAAYQKKAGIVNLLIKESSDPVALYNVAKLGNREVIKFLMKCNANFEITSSLVGWSAIHYAAHQGDYKAVSTLSLNKVDIDKPDNDGNTPLHLAILHKHSRVVEILLVNNAYLSVTNNKGEDAMSLAVQTGNVSILQLLLKHGALVDAPDSEGKIPLVHAILRGHTTIATLLISHGASVTTQRNDHNAISPIRLVCQYGNGDIFRMMADRGTSMEQRDDRRNTLLHIAAKHGRTDVALELITMRGSLVNAENAAGQKPIHLAALEGHAFLVETLLSAGTKVSIMDEDDTVLYEMAKHKEVWDVLRQWATANPDMLVPTPRNHRSGRSPTTSPRRNNSNGRESSLV